MLYEIHCRGHVRRFKSAGGIACRGLHFCGGCQKRPIHKLLKDSGQSEGCDTGLACHQPVTTRPNLTRTTTITHIT